SSPNNRKRLSDPSAGLPDHAATRRGIVLRAQYRMRNFGVLVLLVVAYGCSDAFLFGSECAGVEYDDNKVICCGDKLYEKTEYDDNKVICCGDKLYEKTEYSECCFGEMMDTRLYACFFGKLPNPFSSTCLVQQF
ncbi:hypothetical protein LSAT2_013990, partial [Lamellibrachia satsuma]